VTQTARHAVVVGIDGSAASKDALAWAARQARLTSAELHAVIAWWPPVTYGYLPDYSDADFESDARKVVEEVVDEVLGTDAAVAVTTQVVEGHPAPVLVDAAKEADLLVVGSRGHGAFAGMLLGSTSQHCVQHATTPAVVIRQTPN